MKKIKGVTIFITAFMITVFTGCSSSKLETKPTSKEVSKSETVLTSENKTNNTENKEEKLKKLKNVNGIDFSKIKYIHSETERDTKLEDAFAKVYELKKGSDKVRYYYNKIDLNNDKIPEIFVFLLGPSVSGSGGGSGLIFKTNKDKYELVSKFTLVNVPIIVSANKTNGWNDLIMSVSGGGIEPFYAVMKYGNNKYPMNPSTQPAVKSGTLVEGTAIIAEDISIEHGIEF